jgi:hypothetical protein
MRLSPRRAVVHRSVRSVAGVVALSVDHMLDGVEVGCVAGQSDGVQPGGLCGQPGLHVGTAMRRQAVPDHNDRIAVEQSG